MDLWNVFCRSGKISHYLKYKSAEKEGSINADPERSCNP